MDNQNENIKIDDVARALGISKSTVSRSISGKGRISEATRRRVLEYVEKNNYRPNPIAKGLANSKTYNIAWVVPANSDMNSLSFFQRCLGGVLSSAVDNDYDVIITTTHAYDNRRLKRLIRNQKIDGVVLGETLVEDNNISLLLESGLPFVVIGSTDVPNVIQVDNDHSTACKELTSMLVMKGMKKLAYIGGISSKEVNITRKNGFVSGLGDAEGFVQMNCIKNEEIFAAVTRAIEQKVDCIVCEDDRICQQVLVRLDRMGITVPDKVKIASFYNSSILENNRPPITSLQYDPRELGKVACQKLFDLISGYHVDTKTILGYDVLLKASTQ